MRSFIPQEQLHLWMQAVLSHGYHVLMIDAFSHPRLPL